MTWLILAALLGGIGWYLWQRRQQSENESIDITQYRPGSGAAPRRPSSTAKPEAALDDLDRPGWDPSEQFIESNPRPLDARLRLSYSDAQGERTERDIDVYECDTSNPAGYLIGYCHLREGVRTFRIDRVLRAVDRDTGEIIKDLPNFAAARFKASPAYAILQLLDRSSDALRALFYLGKSDGRFTRKEKEIFLAFCQRTAGDTRITLEQVEDACRILPMPSMQAYKLICGRLAKLPADDRRTIIDTAAAMVATEKTVAAAEAEALGYLRQRLTAGSA